jgi:hypothetical protein
MELLERAFLIPWIRPAHRWLDSLTSPMAVYTVTQFLGPELGPLLSGWGEC